MPPPKDLTGIKFGRLTALRRGPVQNGDRLWLWLCSCGKEKSISVKNIRSGKVVSCGCYLREKSTRHGLSETRTYKIWSAMKHRVFSSRNHPEYIDVSLCERWEDFENFLSDMGECPEGLTIDRVENSKGYEPGNCRWATRRQQVLNRGCTIWVEIDQQIMSLMDACRMKNLPYSTIHHRVKNLGMSPDEALRARKWLR